MFDISQTTLHVFPPASPTQFFQIPSAVEIILPGAFYECEKLQIIMLSDDSKLETISVSAFQGCSNLKYINLPLSVKTIGADCFKYCSSLSCGLIISNTTTEFRNKLIQAGMPTRCFCECMPKMTCKQTRHLNYICFMLFIVI